jgi:hypothetical protein
LRRAVELGVRHLRGRLTDVALAEDGSIAAIHTDAHGWMSGQRGSIADLLAMPDAPDAELAPAKRSRCLPDTSLNK